MFEKLLAVLPYHPGLLGQMSFYGQRMREEASIRRTGLIFIILTFFIQFFAVISPPQPTLAQDDNSLISGGISGPADARNKCRNNVRHYQDIMNFYGITCQDLGEGVPVTIRSTGQNYYSMGWNAYNRPGSNEQRINIKGAGTVYMRKLASFDTNGTSVYQSMRIKASATGVTYHILYSCGNLVSVGLPSPAPAPAPKPEPVKPTPLPSAPNTPAPKPAPAPTPQVLGPQPQAPVTPAPPESPKCAYNPTLPPDSPLCFKPCIYNSSIPAESSQCYQPCQYNPVLSSDDQLCKPCDKGSTRDDNVACVSIHKKASNITANISDANNTTAQPGDTITYTLSATNSGKANVKDFVFKESLSDVLDYADVVDLHGGSLDTYNVVSWPTETIGAGATATHQITVKVKNPIPTTPADPANPDHFNLTMTNVYGDTVNIKVPAPPVKTIQTAAATLPNTGPGTTLAIAATIVVFGGYFYGRARLLARESALAIQENTQA